MMERPPRTPSRQLAVWRFLGQLVREYEPATELGNAASASVSRSRRGNVQAEFTRAAELRSDRRAQRATLV